MLEVIIQLVIYILRWQLSSFILAPVITFGNGRGWSPARSAVIANLIGAIVFFPADKYITFAVAGQLARIF